MLISDFNVHAQKNSPGHIRSRQLGGNGKFVNKKAPEKFSWSKTLRLVKRVLFEKKVDTVPSTQIPVVPLTASTITSLPENACSVVRLGHSSLLIKIANQLWLIDPVFSNRASPFSFLGPKRFHQAPILPESLPAIDGVIISHNHYDHMDKATLQILHDKVKNFVLPIGNGEQNKKMGGK